MFLLKLVIYACLHVGLFVFSVQANQLAIGTYYIPGLIENKNKGNFIEVFKEVQIRANINFVLALSTHKRLQHEFSKRAFIGYFPELDDNLPSNTCRSEGFFQKDIITVTRKNTQPVLSIQQLQGKRVGLVKNYSYGSEITQNSLITFEYSKSEAINIKKLLAERIDVIIGDSSSTLEAIRDSGKMNQLTFDITRPIKQLDVFFVFHNTAQGRQLCNKVSTAIKSMKKDGRLVQLMAGA